MFLLKFNSCPFFYYKQLEPEQLFRSGSGSTLQFLYHQDSSHMAPSGYHYIPVCLELS